MEDKKQPEAINGDMNKPLFVISSAFDTYSGYGARSRDLIKSIVDLNQYKVRLIPQKWGDTSWGFCENNPEWMFLMDLVITVEEQNIKPDIWMQITIPNEFQPVGHFNIGVTAGIESSVCAPDWIIGLNKMDLNLVPSQHSLQVFKTTSYNKKEPNGQTSVISLQKPIEVLFEGFNPEVFRKMDSVSHSNLDDIQEEFCFLVVGHWMKGDLGEDRKNIGLTIKLFLDEFKNLNMKTPPALILKTSIGNSSKISKEEVLKRISNILAQYSPNDDLPSIYLLNSDVSDEQMNEIYNHPKIKALISLTKGEGYGRPLLEFSLTGKPIICSYWSGQIDFLNKDYIFPLKGDIRQIHPSASNQWLVREGGWFYPDHDHVKLNLRNVYKNYDKSLVKGKCQAKYVSENFTLENMKTQLSNILDVFYTPTPQFVDLKINKK